jgi:hypothetical protein
MSGVISPYGSTGVSWLVPSGDATGNTDNAAIIAGMAAGYLFLKPGGQYYVKQNLDLITGGVIIGNGATVSPGSAFAGTGGLLQLASGSVKNTIVNDLILNGNSWAVSSLNGVYYSNTGVSAPNHQLTNVTATGFQGAGFVNTAASASSAAHLTDCRALGNLGDGFQGAVDIKYTTPEAAYNEGHGIHCLNGASNIQITAPHCWYNGVNPVNNTWAGSGTSCGIFVDDNGQYIAISNPDCQQNGLHGIGVGATSGTGGYATEVTITGGTCDTNSCYSANVGHGVFLSGPFACAVHGVAGGNNGALSPGSQEWGLYVTGAATQTDVSGNTIYGSAGQVNCATATGLASAGYLGLAVPAAAGGYALVNGTGAVASWQAPNDGLAHRVEIFANKSITATETGGAVQVAWTQPNGTARTALLFPGGQAAGAQVPTNAGDCSLVIQANSTVTISQSSALTAGGPSTLWAEIMPL